MCDAAVIVGLLSIPALTFRVSRLLTIAFHFFTRVRFDTHLRGFAPPLPAPSLPRRGPVIGFLRVGTRARASVRLFNGFGRSDNRLPKIDLFPGGARSKHSDVGSRAPRLLCTLFSAKSLSDCQ